MLIHETPEFIAAFWAHSDAIDGPVQFPAPQYQDGANLLNFMIATRIFEEQQQNRDGLIVFEELRQAFICSLAEHLRLAGLARLWNRPMPQTPDGFTVEESSAVYLLLNYASIETQDRFMRGEADFRQAIIYAILKDRGLYDERGFWCELVLPWE